MPPKQGQNNTDNLTYEPMQLPEGALPVPSPEALYLQTGRGLPLIQEVEVVKSDDFEFGCRFGTGLFLFLLCVISAAVFANYWTELGWENGAYHAEMGICFLSLFVLVTVGLLTLFAHGGMFGKSNSMEETGCRWMGFLLVFMVSIAVSGIFAQYWVNMAASSTTLYWPDSTQRTVTDTGKLRDLIEKGSNEDGLMSLAEFRVITREALQLERGAHPQALQLSNAPPSNMVERVFLHLDKDEDHFLNIEERAQLEDLANGGAVQMGRFATRKLTLARGAVLVSFFVLTFIELVTLSAGLAFFTGGSGRAVSFRNASDPVRWAIFCGLTFLWIAGSIVFLWFMLQEGRGPKSADLRLTTPAPDFDCVEGFWDWQKKWGLEHQEYCCATVQRACHEDTVYKTKYIHGHAHRHTIYKARDILVPETHKVVRYKYKAVPAPPPPRKEIVRYKYEYVYESTRPFDCDAGWSGGRWKLGWSHAKKEWCCEHESKGCLRWDCHRGFENWYHDWSHEKKEWCCENSNRGCGVPTTSLPFDCSAGVDTCWHGWSEGKKTWCCGVQPDMTPDHCCHHPQHKPAHTCKLWGDPHIVTFDKSHLVFYSEGDFWIVKSHRLKIQGRFQATQWTKDNDHTDYSSMTSIIVSGSAVHHRKLEIQSMEGVIKCDGKEVLKGFGTDYCGPAEIKFDAKGKLVDSAMSFLPHKVVHISLPDGEWIQVNRWPNFINALVSMHADDQQDGVCGNFNGLAHDDSGKELHSRFGHGVERFEDMFDDYLPVHFPTARPSSKRCSEHDLDASSRKCRDRISESADGWTFAECMGDFCDKNKNGGSFQAEMWKKHYHFE
eukprot:TRINITY_DN862_c0_g1_i1.p1 TRINITY_DN862_c0_g1~~TRINITY_DN862_c0_g1_i1.p1  ORF type:complete len:834 (+),score=124.38 TRINITY_DN862_c0_g1_i1:145-2646(+)